MFLYILQSTNLRLVLGLVLMSLYVCYDLVNKSGEISPVK
jgi:hypothetical protein